MEIAQNTSPSGLGEATAISVEGQTERQGTSSAQTLEPPKEAGQLVAKAGVEVVTRLTRD